MCATVDGYRLFLVTDSDGNTHEVSCFDMIDAEVIMKKRGISVQSIRFHPLYGQYVGKPEDEKRLIYDQILDKIYAAA